MADPIREKILKNIKTSLEQIRISNGYQTDITNIQRWEQGGNDLRDTPVIVIYPDEEDKEDENAWPKVKCTLPVLLIFWWRHDKRIFEVSSDEMLSKFLADIEKSIFVNNGHLRGGFAITTRNRGNTPLEAAEGQPFCGFVVRLEVEYEHDLTDPYV